MGNLSGFSIRPARMVSPDSTSIVTFVLDGEGDKVAWIFAAPTTDPFTHIGHRNGGVTGTPPTFSANLQSVSSGLPSGTILGGGSPASGLFTPVGGDVNTWQDIALDNSYAPSAVGELIAAVVEFSSGTINSSNRIFITYKFNTFSFNSGSGNQGIPYALTNGGSSWTKQDDCPIFSIRTATRRYGFPVLFPGQTQNVSTSGHRWAKKFRLPSDLPFTAPKLSRMGIFVDLPNSGSDLTYALWDAAGSVVGSYSMTHPPVVTGGTTDCIYDVPFNIDTVPALELDTWYYAGVQAAGTNLLGVYQQLPSADDRSAYDMGENVAAATWNGSSWTDLTDCLPAIELYFEEGVALGGAPAARSRILSSGVHCA